MPIPPQRMTRRGERALRPASTADDGRRIVGCPRCGGRIRHEIAPGWWRCLEEVYIGERVVGEDRGVPVTRPVTRPVMESCNAEYPEAGDSGVAAAGRLCACGTYPIGVCQECGAPLCGDHSSFEAGRRICTQHVSDRRRAAEQQAAERALAKREAQRRELDEFRSAVADAADWDQLCGLDRSTAPAVFDARARCLLLADAPGTHQRWRVTYRGKTSPRMGGARAKARRVRYESGEPAWMITTGAGDRFITATGVWAVAGPVPIRIGGGRSHTGLNWPWSGWTDRSIEVVTAAGERPSRWRTHIKNCVTVQPALIPPSGPLDWATAFRNGGRDR
jgi:hypothetical protein